MTQLLTHQFNSPNKLDALFSTQVLVVPPFECAWLGGDYILKDGKGCISFEVKGDNDVTLILKPQSGSRRWQHSSLPTAHPGRTSPVDRNYTVILGSHRNSCLKFEKDGDLCCMVDNVPGSKLSATSFTQYWVNYDGGCITVGTGDVDPRNGCYTWRDADPIQDIRFAGLSAWDKHVGYRNICVHPAVDFTKAPSAIAAVDTLGPLTLVETCCQSLLDNVKPSTVCDVLLVADAIAPVIDGLRGRAVEYAAGQFLAVAAADGASFTALSVESLADILRSQALDCEEKLVFDALMQWAGCNNSTPIKETSSASLCRDIVMDAESLETTHNNRQGLEQLLPLVRFPVMSAADLDAATRLDLGQHTGLLKELINEAADAQRAAAAGSSSATGGAAGAVATRGASTVRADRHMRELTLSEQATCARFQRRRPAGCTELLYMYDGDTNGLCWHLGTGYGGREWMNPVVSGHLSVCASSPNCRFTDPRALVSRNFLRTNFAGPKRVDGALFSWWLLDLGEHSSLVCNCYTLRHDASNDFLRNWALQGSHDLITWVDLRRHVDDCTFIKAGQYASWPVTMAPAAFRYFRVVLLVPNVEAPNPHHVSLSYIELYGYFYGGEGQKGDGIHPSSS